MKEEVYSYIVGSIDLLNKSLQIQDSKNLKLFSYLYNNYIDINNKFKITATNQDIQLLSYAIVNIDGKIKKIDNKITTLGSKLDEIIKYINESSKENITTIQQDNKDKNNSWIFLIFKKIWNYIKFIYEKIYKFIFRKRIQRELEEKLERERQAEEKKRKAQQRLIRNILQGNNGYQTKH